MVHAPSGGDQTTAPRLMRVSGEISRDAAVIGNANVGDSICQASKDRRLPTSERLLQAAVGHASGGL